VQPKTGSLGLRALRYVLAHVISERCTADTRPYGRAQSAAAAGAARTGPLAADQTRRLSPTQPTAAPQHAVARPGCPKGTYCWMRAAALRLTGNGASMCTVVTARAACTPIAAATSSLAMSQGWVVLQPPDMFNPGIGVEQRLDLAVHGRVAGGDQLDEQHGLGVDADHLLGGGAGVDDDQVRHDMRRLR